MTSLTDINIQAFAEAVRAELADLPKREIQDLTDGLEADLAEKLAEEGVDFANVSAADYAAELREAAGVASRTKLFSFTAFNANFVEWANSNSARKAVYDFAYSLRPAWWVLRAVVAYVIISTLAMNQIPYWLLVVFVFVSIQWGRKKWLTQKFFSAILVPLNVLAAVLLIPTQSIVTSRIDEYYSLQNIMGNLPSIDGLRLQGVEVNEIKAYDSTGTEVQGLTFEDADGNQLLPSDTTPGAIKVPNITGLGIADLQKVLTDAGINNVDFNRLDNGLDSEVQVIRTEPAAGSWIDATSTLLVVVGKFQN